MDGIVYQSLSGHTRAYAKLLGAALGLRAYDVKEAGQLAKGAQIIYLGWLRAGEVMGYKKAAARFQVACLCGVGMAGPGMDQVSDMKKRNPLGELPVYYLQGGLEMDKLKGPYKWMLDMLKKSMLKSLAAKANRTPEEDDMLDLIQKGGSRVDEKNLAPIIAWYKGE